MLDLYSWQDGQLDYIDYRLQDKIKTWLSARKDARAYGKQFARLKNRPWTGK